MSLKLHIMLKSELVGHLVSNEPIGSADLLTDILRDEIAKIAQILIERMQLGLVTEIIIVTAD